MQNKKGRDKSPISPFSNKCNDEINKYKDLTSIKEKYLKKTSQMCQQLYTPIANRNLSNVQMYIQSCKNQGYRRDLGFEENENQMKQLNDSKQRLEDRFSQSMMEQDSNEVVADDKKIQQLIDKLQGVLDSQDFRISQRLKCQFIQTLNKQVKISKFLEKIARNKDYQCKYRTLRQLKQKCMKKLVLQNKLYRIMSILQKYRITQQAQNFYKWKYDSQIEDLNEQLQLEQNDLIIEKSKLVMMVAFSKLDTKLSITGKIKALNQIKLRAQFNQKLASLARLRSKFIKRQAVQNFKNNVHKSQQQKHKILRRILNNKIKANISLLQKSFMKFIINEKKSYNRYISSQQQNQVQANGDKHKNFKIGTEQKLQMKVRQPKETTFYGIKTIQRLVHSQPNLNYQYNHKLINLHQNNKQSIKSSKKRNNPKHYNKKSLQIVEIDVEENEEEYTAKQLLQPNHFAMNLAAINDESLIRFSPSHHSKRNSLSNYHRLNISNILKNGGQDTIDEEDHIILSRLIQKYQRDFNNLSSNNPDMVRRHKLHGSNYSLSTLNLNSHETQGAGQTSNILGNNINQHINTSNQNNGSMLHRKLNSMVQLDKSNFFNQHEQNSKNHQQYAQDSGLQGHKNKFQTQEMLQNLFAFGQYTPNGAQEKHIMIDEEDEYMDDGEDDQDEGDQDNSIEEKLSFTSPSSERLRNMKGKRVNSNNMIFNDQRDNSISVSKIEDVEIDPQYQTHSRIEFQQLQQQNEDENGQGTNNKKDFSFSIEKDKDQYIFSGTQERDNIKVRRNKKKEGNSRNYHKKQLNLSKQERENMALNELTNVLNQQYMMHQNLRSSDLVAGGTYGGGSVGYHPLIYNPQLEQETANFNIGDWNITRSPMGSIHQNLYRPLTRSSLICKSSQRSNKHQQSILSQIQNEQNHLYSNQLLNSQKSGERQLSCQRKLIMISSPDQNNIRRFSQYSQTPSNNNYQLRQGPNDFIMQQNQLMQNYEDTPVDTVSKLNFNYLDQDQQDSQSPLQAQSHFANFSQDFISPERLNKTLNAGATTHRKENSIANINKDASLILNTSGVTTFAQQSAFEQFRTKLNENLKNLQPKNNIPSQFMEFHHQRQQSLAIQNAQPLSVNISPNPKQNHVQSKASDLESQNQVRNFYQSNQVSTRKLRSDPNEIYQSILNMNSHQQSINQIQNDQILLKFNPSRYDARQRESAQNFDLADPMEMGSTFNSIQNFHMKQSIHQMISIKENINPQLSLQEQIIHETFDDHDITLRKSPEPQSSKNYQHSSQYQASIPILQFDINSVEDNVKFENMRQSKDKNNLEFILQTQQSIDNNNHFSKRTMSHNDLVQLGTMSQQQTLGPYLTQRSQSIQQFDLMNTVNENSNSNNNNNQVNQVQFGNQQNKFIDAFKQYEAEKIKKRKSDNQAWKINNFNSQQSQTQDKFGIKDQLLQGDNNFLSFNQLNQNYYLQTQNSTIPNQQNSKVQVRSSSPQPEFFNQNHQKANLGEAAQSCLINIDDNDETSSNGQIIEREAEEEESFIIADHSKHVKMPKQKSLAGLFKDGTNYDNNTLSTILNQNNTQENINESNFNTNADNKNSRQKSLGSLGRKPKEIVIQLDISQYASGRTDDRSMNNISQYAINDKSSILNETTSRNLTQIGAPSKNIKSKSKTNFGNATLNSNNSTNKNNSTLNTITQNAQKNNQKSKTRYGNVKNQTINIKSQTQQLLISELLKQQTSKNGVSRVNNLVNNSSEPTGPTLITDLRTQTKSKITGKIVTNPSTLNNTAKHKSRTRSKNLI
ncbi:UNKNOWN [Stylonychia lemnae]|uniref:Uncharacterized protein n=1 Tax=Stylonychia lemnae TaxID=5949 RepID=A0A078ACV0_STYLE|nr:UNKNOWN [Stylonychia lemnae]|eukprot:CDW80029.1 UNKNOWN [Stylonychia lemnae]